MKNKVRSQELQIQQMEQKLSASVVENLDQARKSHCYLHQLKDQLAKTLCEKNEYRHKYEQIKMTHQSLVEFLEKNRSHLPFSHPQ
ncbi:MAG: hypothetical protein JAY71_19365 [Candidatus Thiodiazotropha weberae]|nr:hypothetical protein [Candidatus Thiodiazotropha weberae]